MRGILGVDLDNTIIDYTLAYSQIAEDFGLPPAVRDRQSIRDTLRTSGKNDYEWQRFQTILYTDGLRLAKPSAGVLEFLDHAHVLGWSTVIVSHKTEFSQLRFGGLPMREAASRWLEENRIVPARVTPGDVFYEASQPEKLARIRRLGCEIFVDDLESVVFHHDRPVFTKMVQYIPGSAWVKGSAPGVAGHGDFAAIGRWLIQC